MSVTTSFLVGSVEDMPARALSVAGGGGGATSVPTGDYYLYDVVDARSLLAALSTVVAAEGITDALFVLTLGGFVRFTSSVSATITWTDTALRDLLGFTGTLGPTTGFTAPNKSPIFWSPGWPETAQSPQGTQGTTIADIVVSSSASGQTKRHRKRTTRTENRFTWRVVPQARAWTTAVAGGEYKRFHDDVVEVGERWKLYGNVAEDLTSTTAFSSEYTLGPYKQSQKKPRWWSRVDPNRDELTDVDIRCDLVSEYT